MRCQAAALVLFAALFLAGCGGGGGNSGTCSGSDVYCAEFANAQGGSGSTGGSVTGTAFSRSGTGDAQFTLPASVKQVRIQAEFTGDFATFLLDIDNTPKVSARLGTSQSTTHFDGSFPVESGATIQIRNATGVSWTVTEIS